MVATLQGVPFGSIVHRFITSGKPGKCELCPNIVEKLEAHHIKYDPEITINLCHQCHHRVHFWPRRITEEEKFKILKKVFPEQKAIELSKFKFADVQELAKIIAPSRKKFIHEAQKLDELCSGKENKTPLKVFSKNKQILKAIEGIKRLRPKSPVQVLSRLDWQKKKTINTSTSLNSQQANKGESSKE